MVLLVAVLDMKLSSFLSKFAIILALNPSFVNYKLQIVRCCEGAVFVV